MAHSAGVAGVVRSFRKVVRAAHSSVDLGDPFLPQLRRLIQKYHVILRALVLIQIGVRGTIAELDRARIAGLPVREREALLRLVVSGNPMQYAQKRRNVVVNQLRVRFADYKYANPVVSQPQQNGLISNGPALPASTCPAIGRVPVCVFQKTELLFVGLAHQFPHIHNHRHLHPFTRTAPLSHRPE